MHFNYVYNTICSCTTKLHVSKTVARQPHIATLTSQERQHSVVDVVTNNKGYCAVWANVDHARRAGTENQN